jgi:hypothetical protein
LEKADEESGLMIACQGNAWKFHGLQFDLERVPVGQRYPRPVHPATEIVRMTHQTKWPENRFAAANDKPSAMVRVSPPLPGSTIE